MAANEALLKILLKLVDEVSGPADGAAGALDRVEVQAAEAAGALDRLVNPVERLLEIGPARHVRHFGLGHDLLQPAGRILDDGQGVVDLMGHARCHGPQRHQPLGDHHLLRDALPELALLLRRPEAPDLVLGLGDLAHQVLDLDRFREIIEGARLDPLHPVLGVGMAGQQNHLRCGIKRLDPLQRFDAVQARHLDVHDDHVDGLLLH